MRNKKFLRYAGMIILLVVLSACSNSSKNGLNSNNTIVIHNNGTEKSDSNSGQIYLYGEAHSVEAIQKKELELWNDYYHTKGMRHLFIEESYYGAEFLNEWMKAKDDTILNEMYNDLQGTVSYNPLTLVFFKTIKEKCPETVFHGTDVGHQYHSTGKRYLQYFEAKNQKDSKQYKLAEEAINQGITFYEHQDFAYRENKMVENFIREYNEIKGESIMGIYGSAHTGLDSMSFDNSVPCMATQLEEVYGSIIQSYDLSCMVDDQSYVTWVIDPIRIDTIKIGNKEYTAAYYGKDDMRGFKDYSYSEFWRIENAYETFKTKPLVNNVLPFQQFPMLVQIGQVFVVDFTKTDNSVERVYYRSDGEIWNNMEVVTEFTL